MELISILPSVITIESQCTDTRLITVTVIINIGIIVIIIIMFQKMNCKLQCQDDDEEEYLLDCDLAWPRRNYRYFEGTKCFLLIILLLLQGKKLHRIL